MTSIKDETIPIIAPEKDPKAVIKPIKAPILNETLCFTITKYSTMENSTPEAPMMVSTNTLMRSLFIVSFLALAYGFKYSRSARFSIPAIRIFEIPTKNWYSIEEILPSNSINSPSYFNCRYPTNPVINIITNTIKKAIPDNFPLY